MHPVVHAVQTNATLIDEAWCEVFSTTPVRVTVSVDGPGEENASRVDWAGQPSTVRAMNGIDMLRRAGITFGMIAVVADLSPGAASRLYRFACELGCGYLGVNLAEKKGVYAGGQEPETGVIAFWEELAANWQADPRIRVRELDHAYTYIREDLSGAAAQRADRPLEPLPLVTWDGHFLPVGAELAGFCSSRYGPFTAGNVLDTPLAVLAARAQEVPWVAEAVAGITNCRKQCEYFAYCRGGQVANNGSKPIGTTSPRQQRKRANATTSPASSAGRNRSRDLSGVCGRAGKHDLPSILDHRRTPRLPYLTLPIHGLVGRRPLV
ncbi:hypothetical protein [Actinoallomurus liliacearum]